MSIENTVVEKLRSFLKSEGLKWTPERISVLEEMSKSHEHLEAEELLARLRKKDSKISRATVYRTLELLVKSGLIQRLSFEGNRGYYEYTYGVCHHDHMICVSCGKVIEFHDDIIEKHQSLISKEHRFEIIAHSHQIFGFCSNRCKNRGIKTIRKLHA